VLEMITDEIASLRSQRHPRSFFNNPIKKYGKNESTNIDPKIKPYP